MGEKRVRIYVIFFNVKIINPATYTSNVPTYKVHVFGVVLS
jgi:hypothetical protein